MQQTSGRIWLIRTHFALLKVAVIVGTNGGEIVRIGGLIRKRAIQVVGLEKSSLHLIRGFERETSVCLV